MRCFIIRTLLMIIFFFFFHVPLNFLFYFIKTFQSFPFNYEREKQSSVLFNLVSPHALMQVKCPHSYLSSSSSFPVWCKDPMSLSPFQSYFLCIITFVLQQFINRRSDQDTMIPIIVMLYYSIVWYQGQGWCFVNILSKD